MKTSRSRTVFALKAAFQAALVSCSSCRESEPQTTTPTTSLPIATATAPATATMPLAVASASSDPQAIPSTGSTPVGSVEPLFPGFPPRCLGKVVRGLTPATPVDYLELRVEYFAPTRAILNAGSVGTPCARAKDRAACGKALSTVAPKWRGEYFVYTRGDEVGTVTGKDVLPFFAPIESAEEAAVALVFPRMENSSGGAVLTTCDPAQYRATPEGFEVVDVHDEHCGPTTRTTLRVARDGAVTERDRKVTPSQIHCGNLPVGRRPAGLEASSRPPSSSALGDYFARSAELEAASVCAFRRLAGELGRRGAGDALRRRARRSAADEVIHAEAMSRVARRFGGRVARPHVAPEAPRDLEAMAIENAVEGCVSETYGAILATWQSQRAEDEGVREAMGCIARDETRHAALAWDIAAWIEPQLSARARARVAKARRYALGALREAVGVAPDAEVARIAGLPSAEAALALIDACTLFDPRRPRARAIAASS